MTSMRDRLSTAVTSAETDSALFHEIVHGTDTMVVATEGGNVPSVAKAIKDIRTSITTESGDIVKIAREAAQTASEKAIICKESEKFVLENVKSSENAKVWAEGTDAEVEECGGTHSARGWVELARKTTIGSYPTEVSGCCFGAENSFFKRSGFGCERADFIRHCGEHHFVAAKLSLVIRWEECGAFVSPFSRGALER